MSVQASKAKPGRTPVNGHMSRDGAVMAVRFILLPFYVMPARTASYVVLSPYQCPARAKVLRHLKPKTSRQPLITPERHTPLCLLSSQVNSILDRVYRQIA